MQKTHLVRVCTAEHPSSASCSRSSPLPSPLQHTDRATSSRLMPSAAGEVGVLAASQRADQMMRVKPIPCQPNRC